MRKRFVSTSSGPYSIQDDLARYAALTAEPDLQAYITSQPDRFSY